MSNHIQNDFVAGREAFKNGETIEDNPYKIQGSAARMSWEAGYIEEWYATYIKENSSV